MTARRPIYVRTSNYRLSRSNARTFTVFTAILFVCGVVALFARPSLALPCLVFCCLAGLLWAQNAATAAWLRRQVQSSADRSDQ